MFFLLIFLVWLSCVGARVAANGHFFFQLFRHLLVLSTHQFHTIVRDRFREATRKQTLLLEINMSCPQITRRYKQGDKTVTMTGRGNERTNEVRKSQQDRWTGENARCSAYVTIAAWLDSIVNDLARGEENYLFALYCLMKFLDKIKVPRRIENKKLSALHVWKIDPLG